MPHSFPEHGGARPGEGCSSGLFPPRPPRRFRSAPPPRRLSEGRPPWDLSPLRTVNRSHLPAPRRRHPRAPSTRSLPRRGGANFTVDDGRHLVARRDDHIDDHCRAWIEGGPFVVISTASATGAMDVSPKGEAPGFVRVLDPTSGQRSTAYRPTDVLSSITLKLTARSRTWSGPPTSTRSTACTTNDAAAAAAHEARPVECMSGVELIPPTRNRCSTREIRDGWIAPGVEACINIQKLHDPVGA